MANSQYFIHRMEAQIVPSRSLAFTEQTADHASRMARSLLLSRLPLMRHPAGKHDVTATHSRHQSQFQPARNARAGGRLEAAWLRRRTGDRLRDTGRMAIRDR